MDKIFWYIEKLIVFLFVCICSLIYCLLHPKKFFELFFMLFSTINEFYQYSKSKLLNFKESKVFQGIQKNVVYAKSNVFNIDPDVARPMETQVLSSLVNYFKPKSILEIGTYNGFTAMHFALNTPPDSIVYTLDLPADFKVSDTEKLSYDDKLVIELSAKNVHQRIFKGTSEESKIVELFGDSKNFDFSPYYGKLDLVFIDGNHSYAYVKSDTEQAFKMLSEKGMIIWHDYDYIIHRDVFNYLNNLARQYKIYFIPNTRFAIYGKTL